MKTTEKRCKVILRMMAGVLGVILMTKMLLMGIQAESGSLIVPGKIYRCEKGNDYGFEEMDHYEEANAQNAYGEFLLKGPVSKETGTKNGYPIYKVSDGELQLHYDYGDELLRAELDSWHLVEDKSDEVGGIKLDDAIKKGALIVQASKDQMNWVNVSATLNAFADTPIRTVPIYMTEGIAKDIQLANGCYYRVIVAYHLRIRTGTDKILFVEKDQYEGKRIVEVYEFYAYGDNQEGSGLDIENAYVFQDRVRVENFEGYSGQKTMDSEDVHHNINIGRFYVSGYTGHDNLQNGDVVFLKNAGDKVTLWFNLEQNIDAIGGDKKVTVTADPDGWDEYFETGRKDFGRGALIIRKTDHNNNKEKWQLYKDYLLASAMPGANTVVQLCEEGDYEVALDYEITAEGLLADKVGHYRIFFRFSVRNGNCMIYPFDLGTGSELSNSSMTETGFRLDLARSRYLKVNLKREVMKDSADGLVEDIRFNGPAKEGKEYRDEGIYTITAFNPYTNVTTEKKIYVGTNNVMKAHMATGKSIQEINSLLAQGAVIDANGRIELPVKPTNPVAPVTPVAPVNPEAETPDVVPKEEEQKEEKEEVEATQNEGSKTIFVVGACGAVGLLVVVLLVVKKQQIDQGSEM